MARRIEHVRFRLSSLRWSLERIGIPGMQTETAPLRYYWRWLVETAGWRIISASFALVPDPIIEGVWDELWQVIVDSDDPWFEPDRILAGRPDV
jgi:hypothetical protein